MSSITEQRLQCSVEHCERRASAPRGFCWPHYKRVLRYSDPEGGRKAFNGDTLKWLRWAARQETDDCLPFPFAGASEYGVVLYAGESMIAPRAVALMVHGDPYGRIVTHRCKTKPCCNKRHLSWGSRDSNMKDRIRDGTNRPGEASAVAKLTDADVAKIRSLRGREVQTVIAKMFGISQTHVSEIQLRKTWRHL